MNELEKLWAAAQAALANGAPRDQVEASVAKHSAGMTLDDLEREVTRVQAQRDSARAAINPGPVKGTALSAINGLMWGGLPRFIAAHQKGQRRPEGDEYAAAVEKARAPLDEFARTDPRKRYLTEIAAGMLTVPGLNFGVGKTLASTVARTAATGAVAGGASALASSTPGQELPSMGRGAAFGSMFALPFGLGAGLARAAVPSAERSLAGAIENSPGGLPAVRARAAEMAPRGGMLADLSPQLRREAEFASTFGTTVRQAQGEQLAARQSGQAERIGADLRDALRTSPVASQRLKVLQSQRRQWADSPEGYGGLPDQAVEGGMEFMNQPKVSAAVSEAQQLNLIGKLPNPTPDGVFTLNQLQHVKRRLDAAATQAFRKGDGDLGKRLAEVRDDLVGTIEAANPGYRSANATYKALVDRERALTAGFRMSGRQIDPAELKDLAGQLAPEALQEFRYGLAAGLRKQLQTAATNRNVAQRIVNASEGDTEMLRLIFGNEADLNTFLRGTKMEADMAATLRRAFGGSETAPRSAMQTGAHVASAALSPFGFMHVLGRVGIRAMSDKAREGMANKMAPYLFKGGDELMKLIEEINQKAQPGMASRAAQTYVPAAGGYLLGRNQ